MITLFVDTNVLLSFYYLTKEDLEELRKLVALIGTMKINLVLTEQVRDEFGRNRAAKIADAMKKLQEAQFRIAFPNFAKDYPEYDELRTLLDKAGKKHAELVQTLTGDATRGLLKADALVADLFQKATVVPVSDKIYLAALKRVRLGNPPGKENSLGDAVNWECLLATIGEGEDVHFVSDDKDYRSRLPPSFNEFLDLEWKACKGSEIVFHSKISDFFSETFPTIKLASEVEQNWLIEDLRKSGSFTTTHLVVAKLLRHKDFSPLQIEELVQIARSNRQVGWIIGDPDVHGFYASLLQKHQDELASKVLAQLNQLVDEGEAINDEREGDDDIPF